MSHQVEHRVDGVSRACGFVGFASESSSSDERHEMHHFSIEMHHFSIEIPLNPIKSPLKNHTVNPHCSRKIYTFSSCFSVGVFGMPGAFPKWIGCSKSL
jgi:hypothetical protein